MEEKKPIYKRWWAILIGIILVLGFIGSTGKYPAEQIKPEEKQINASEEKQSKSTSKPINNNDEQPKLPLIKGTVTKVVDGDTAYIRLADGKEEKVRFIGVDTPESTIQHEPYGEEASSFTKTELNGKTVYLEIDVEERDKYGRLLAYIWLSEPTEINDTEIRSKQFNARLLLDGYAQLMTIPPNVKYIDYYTKYQAESREASKGLWGIEAKTTNTVTSEPSKAITPTSSPPTVYITNTGAKYHSGWCRYLSKSKIPISLSEAMASGYGPCSVCNPPS